MASDGDSAEVFIPKAEPGDLEDVSWALSTAEASWQRGDRVESLKWLRRAAEAATEGSANVRAVFLARAAADLASALERRSMPPTMGAPPPPPTSPSVVATARSGPPAPPSARPPAPGPASQRPPAPGGARASGTPPLPPRRATPAPFSAAMHPSRMPLPAQPPTASTLNSRGNDAKKTRKSSHGLEAEAKAAKHQGPDAAPKTGRAPRQSATSEASRRRRTSRPPPPTEEHPSTEPGAPGHGAGGGSSRTPSVADEIDAWPTQAMESTELAGLTSEMSRPAPPSVPRPSPSARPPAPARDGTTTAVRVLVWRASEGIRVAPAGSVVPAPAVEAILVSLDPSADLAAWLGRR